MKLSSTQVHSTEPTELNPDFVSSMTKNHWKLYRPDETLAMFQRAEYKLAKNKYDVQVAGVRTANAQDNLDEAHKYLKQAENTIVKLKTELREFSKQTD